MEFFLPYFSDTCHNFFFDKLLSLTIIQNIQTMTINIQFIKIQNSDTLTEFVSKKLIKLSDKYKWLISAKVLFKIEKEPAGNGNICEIELSLPGPKIFASSKEKNFELAAKNTISDLTVQLKKRKASFVKH